MLHMTFSLVTAGTAAPYLPPPGTGVTVRLENERELVGTFLGEREGVLWIGVDQGEIGLGPAQIVSVSQSENDDVEYRRRAARLGRDAGGWWALARWARERGLEGSAAAAAQRVIELQPDHAGARALLGQERVGGAWLERDEARRAQGLVEHGSEWLKPEQAEALERARREARHEERLDAYLELERRRLEAAATARPHWPLPWAYGWETVGLASGGGSYTVLWRRREPFQPHFHEGYFLRREP